MVATPHGARFGPKKQLFSWQLSQKEILPKAATLQCDTVPHRKGGQCTVPAVWIVIEAINGSITTGEADVVETSYCQTTIYSNIYKVLLFPSLHIILYVLSGKLYNHSIRKKKVFRFVTMNTKGQLLRSNDLPPSAST